MKVLLSARAAAVLLLVGLIVFGVTVASAQRKKKPSRRVAHPVTATSSQEPTSSSTVTEDPKIVSTADQQPGSDPAGSLDPAPHPRTSGTRRAQPTNSDTGDVNQTIDRLSTQVTKLGDRMSAMEDDQKGLILLERLGRVEQRAEELRAQLRDVQSKELDYQARMEQLQLDMLPENIDMSIATFGTTRPEELRAQRRVQLENEKKRVQAQLDLLATSRTRLESALATADAQIEKLKERVDAEDPTKTGDKAQMTPKPQTEPQPTEPQPTEQPPVP